MRTRIHTCASILSNHGSSWYLYQIVDQNTVRTYVVNQVFRLVEGIWLHRKSRQIRFFFRKKKYFASYLRNMVPLFYLNFDAGNGKKFVRIFFASSVLRENRGCVSVFFRWIRILKKVGSGLNIQIKNPSKINFVFSNKKSRNFGYGSPLPPVRIGLSGYDRLRTLCPPNIKLRIGKTI